MKKERGLKDTKDKNRVDLITPESILGIGEVLTFGAKKYSPNNWQLVEAAQDKYYAALMRHLLAWRQGEAIDPESKLNHIKHVLTNAMFLLYYEK